MMTKLLTGDNLNNVFVQNAYSMLVGNLYLKDKEKKYRTITITSCNPKEGKSSISTSLAMTLSNMNKKTLLVNMDFRQSVPRKLTQQSVHGIAQYLRGDVELDKVICKTNYENLYYLDSGNISGDPTTMLCSEKLKEFIAASKEEFEYVIFNTPSLECISDSLILASMTDATVLVCRVGYTTIIELKKAQDQLKGVNANMIGVILNRVGKSLYKKRFASFKYYSSIRNTKTNNFLYTNKQNIKH